MDKARLAENEAKTYYHELVNREEELMKLNTKVAFVKLNVYSILYFYKSMFNSCVCY